MSVEELQNNRCIRGFISYCKLMGKKHPELQEEIQDTFELMLYEIEDGGNITEEIDTAMSHIEDEIEELGYNE